MGEDKRIFQEIDAFQQEFSRIVVECQKFCFITRAREFQAQARDKLIPLKAKAEQLKERAIADEYEDAANAMLSFEEMTNALINELNMWIALKDDKPATAWDFLVDAQMATITAMQAHHVADHLEGYSMHLSALEKHMFPNHGFFSIGAIVKKSECSICGQEYGECDHLINKPYMGKICFEHVKELELEEISLVFNPGNKHCRTISITDDEGIVRDALTWQSISNASSKHYES
ncbi:MAG TPA: hypothetical protein VGL94_01660 [Ktedonobacteraceae bacterium]|jgi:hypothetical protein